MESQKRKQAKTRTGMRITTVALPWALHRRLQIVAAESNTAANEIMREALREWLSRRREKR